VLALGILLMGCPVDGGTSPVEETFTGTAADGTIYTLAITDGAYVLTVGDKTSSGTAEETALGYYTLTPSKSAPPFTVTITNNGGIFAMSGIITFTDNSTAQAPATLTPPLPPAGKGITITFIGSDERNIGNFLLLALTDYNTFSSLDYQGRSYFTSISAPGLQTFIWDIKPPAGNYYIVLVEPAKNEARWYYPDGKTRKTIYIDDSGETTTALNTDDLDYYQGDGGGTLPDVWKDSMNEITISGNEFVWRANFPGWTDWRDFVKGTVSFHPPNVTFTPTAFWIVEEQEMTGWDLGWHSDPEDVTALSEAWLGAYPYTGTITGTTSGSKMSLLYGETNETFILTKE
jgi:hypothetical protein